MGWDLPQVEVHWAWSSLSSQVPIPHSLYCTARDMLLEKAAFDLGISCAFPFPRTMQGCHSFTEQVQLLSIRCLQISEAHVRRLSLEHVRQDE